MNRRTFTFAGLSAATLPLTATRIMFAQPATPQTDSDLTLGTYVNLDGVTQAVFRSYDVQNSALYRNEGIFFLQIWGFQFNAPPDLDSTLTAFSTGIANWIIVNNDIPSMYLEDSPAKLVSVRALGDASAACTWRSSVRMEDTSAEPIFFGTVGILQGTTLQILIAATTEDKSPLRPLAEIAEPLLTKWPNDDPEREERGQMVGGLWDVLPTLNDLDLEGVSILNSQDVTAEFGPDPEPVFTPAIGIHKDVKLQGVTRAVFRRYHMAPDATSEPSFSINSLSVWGIACETPKQARQAIDSLSSAFQRADIFIRTGTGQSAEITNLHDVAIRQLGDFTKATTWALGLDGVPSTTPSLVLGIVQESTVQILQAISTFPVQDDLFTDLVDFAESMLIKWPNDDPEREERGLMIGGLWDTLPTLTDFDVEGVGVSYTFDVTEELQQ